MTVFESYITNLGKYAEGQLVGETLKFPATTEEVQSLLKNIGVDGVRYEEFFITAFDGDVMGLYEDNVAGKIDDARFAKMSKRYEQEQGENAKKIKALRLELKKDESKRMDIDDFLETVRRYTDATTITKRMVAELIDHIEVYHAEKQDGVTNQRVVIYYNCIGAFDVPDRRKIPEADIIMETRKGVALSYAPEQVAV